MDCSEKMSISLVLLKGIYRELQKINKTLEAILQKDIDAR